MRLAANQRCLEVHILDHLDEIDRRGLALRRGFSSLFDYAVRELRFSDAAAQRRIQAMRLCRRHGWVRACLQSGELSMTSAGQLETTFAGAERAERAERQSNTGHRNVGHDQDHDSAGRTRQLGLPAAPGEADEQGERGHRSEPGFTPPAAECSGDVREREHRSAPGGAPPAGECTGEVAAGNTPAVPVASRSGAQAPGGVHAGALLPRPELNGNASPFPAPSCAPVAANGAGPAAPSSDEGPAPQLLPPTNFSASTPEPEPVMAPSESRHTASRAPEPPRDDPVTELSPGPLSAAPLLHPQRQRELIEQATGMSTRQVAGLLAAAAPEVLPPRDTLRAVAPDRYTLKVSIDQECEQGLRRLKDLMSHVDPRMSWGDLVARLVRDAVARHDPRGGGSGQRRRRSAGSAGASPRRAPKETRAAGPAGVPAQRVGESSGRAPNRTRAAGAAAGPAQRVDESSGRAPNRTRAAVAPVAPARRTGGATPAPPGDTSATDRQNPIGVLANTAPPSQSGPAAPLDGARAGGAPSGGAPAARARRRVRSSAPQSARHCWMAPVQAALHRARPPLLRRRSSRPAPWRMAPMPAQAWRARRSPLRRRSGHFVCPLTADRAARRTEQRAWPRRMASLRAQAYRARRSSLRRRSRYSAGPLTVDRAARRTEQRAWPRRLASLRAQAYRARRSPPRRRSRHSAGPLKADRPTHQPGQRRTRPAILSTAATNPRHGATFRRRSGATSGYATVDAAVIAIRSPGDAAPLPICCRSTTCCQSPRGVARSRPTSISCAQLITECATATDRLCRRNPRCSASSARLARRSTAPADSLQVARRGYTSQPREPSVHLRYRLFRPLPVASRPAVPHVRRRLTPGGAGNSLVSR